MSYALNGKAGYRDGAADTAYVETPIAFHSTQDPISSDVAPAMGKEEAGTVAIAFAWQQGDDSKFHEGKGGRSWITRAGDYTGALSRTRHDAVAGDEVGVRRLTPRECERLQGLPDDWTAPESLGGPAEYRLSAKGKWRSVRGSGVTDNLRYAAIGNAVTVDVAEWIGRRIAAVGMRRAAR